MPSRKTDNTNPTFLSPAEVEEMFRILQKQMPGRTKDAKGPKDQPDPFRSCISCMLSAQSRDWNTRLATTALFQLACTPEEMLLLSQAEIAAAIKPCGLYNSKAKNIHRFCQTLLADFDGRVPRTRAELMSLPGIGRKCADIVQQFAFDIDVIAVDTHVHRVCNRTGLAVGKTAEATARSLEERAPEWTLHEGHFWLIQFGKQICHARTPRCKTCSLNHLCRYYRSIEKADA